MASKTLHRSAVLSIPLVLLGLCLLGQRPGASSYADGTQGALPGGTEHDTYLARQEPFEFAWTLFLALNRQGDPAHPGSPDATQPDLRTYDDDKDVVWETWAKASGGRAGGRYQSPNSSEVFLDHGAEPLEWGKWNRGAFSPSGLEPFGGARQEFLEALSKSQPHFRPMFDRAIAAGVGDEGEEVRMNQATYDHVRGDKLYSIELLEKAFSQTRDISLPRGAQEIKALWRRIPDEARPRFHWRSFKKADNSTEYWGLYGIHFITRDLPNWFWCDFEHVDTEKNAELPSVDPTTRDEDGTGGGAGPKGSGGVRGETKNTKWQYYRLRGTQVDFTDSEGRPTVLANTGVERGFQQTSSCITCHARATVGLRDRVDKDWRPKSLPVFEAREPFAVGAIGTPNKGLYLDIDLRRRFIQTDFLWSIPFRVLSEKVEPPKPQ